MTAEHGLSASCVPGTVLSVFWCVNASRLVDHLTSCAVIPASQVGDTGNSLCPFLNHDSPLLGILEKVRSLLKTEYLFVCLFIYLRGSPTALEGLGISLQLSLTLASWPSCHCFRFLAFRHAPPQLLKKINVYVFCFFAKWKCMNRDSLSVMNTYVYKHTHVYTNK